MSKSEKRFFKLSASVQAGQKNYFKLFDLVEGQRRYKEEAIKVKLPEIADNLPSAKNYLYKLILKSLRLYDAEASAEAILRQEIKNVEILFQRGFFKECNKFVTKAKSIAEKHEKFYYWLELINWQKALLDEEYESGCFEKNIDDLVREEQMVMAKHQNISDFQSLCSRLNFLTRSGGASRNSEELSEIESISNHKLITDGNQAKSVRAKVLLFYIQGLCSLTNGYYNLGIEKFNHVIELLDDHKSIRLDLINIYFRAFRGVIYTNIANHEYVLAATETERLQSLKRNRAFVNKDIQLKIFTYSSAAKLIIAQRVDSQESALLIANEVIKGIKKNDGHFSKEQLAVLYYNLSTVYFYCHDFKESLKWVNKLLNENESTIRQDIYWFGRIVNCLIHFELRNSGILKCEIRSIARHLRIYHKDLQAEQLVISYISQLYRVSNEADKYAIYSQMVDELSDILRNPSEKVVLRYFDFIGWAKNKMAGLEVSVENSYRTAV